MFKFITKKALFLISLFFSFFFLKLFSDSYEPQVEWEKGSQINRREDLSQAIKNNDIIAAKILILYLDNINAPLSDQNEMTPLMEAAFYASPDLVDLLIYLGADIKASDKYGYTALSHAACHAENVNSYDAELVITSLIKAGANLETAGGHNNETPLIRCCYKEIYTPIVKLLIKENANIEATNNFGKTPLMIGAKHENVTITQYLLEAGSCIDTRDYEGRTALTLAAMSNNNTEVLALLIMFGADLNVVDLSGKTPLMNSLHSNKKTLIIKFLIESGAQTKIPTSKMPEQKPPKNLKSQEQEQKLKESNASASTQKTEKDPSLEEVAKVN